MKMTANSGKVKITIEIDLMSYTKPLVDVTSSCVCY